MTCCDKFLVPIGVSCVFMNVEFKLHLLILSVKTVLKFKCVVSVVTGVTPN